MVGTAESGRITSGGVKTVLSLLPSPISPLEKPTLAAALLAIGKITGNMLWKLEIRTEGMRLKPICPETEVGTQADVMNTFGFLGNRSGCLSSRWRVNLASYRFSRLPIPLIKANSYTQPAL